MESERKLNQPNYLLDWETFAIHTPSEIGSGSHELKHPTPEQESELIAAHMQARNGKATDAANVRLFDEICIKSAGYDGKVPSEHKAAVIAGLYDRQILLHEIRRSGSIVVLEKFDRFETIYHELRLPKNDELKNFPTKALEMAGHYDLLLKAVDGVKLRNGDTPTIDQCVQFLPLPVKLAVFNSYLKGIMEILEVLPGSNKEPRKLRRKSKRRH